MSIESNLKEYIAIYNGKVNSIDANVVPSVANALLTALAMKAEEIRIDVNRKKKESTPLTTTSLEGLYGWAELTDVERLQPTKSSGVITAYGDVGTVIPSGTKFRLLSGQEFEVTTGDTISGTGSVNLFIESVEVGSGGNAAKGSKFQLATGVSGLETDALAYNDIVGGSDLECIENYKERIVLDFKSTFGQGTKCWLEKQVRTWSADVTKVYIGGGCPCMPVYFLMHKRIENGIPTQGDVDSLQAYLDEPCRVSECVCAEVGLLEPKAVTLSFGSGCTSYPESTIETLQQRVDDYIMGNAYPGQTLRTTDIDAIVREVAPNVPFSVQVEPCFNSNEINVVPASIL